MRMPNPTSTSTRIEWPEFKVFFLILFFVLFVSIKIIRFHFPLSILILLFWVQFFDWILKLKTFKMQKHSISGDHFIIKWFWNGVSYTYIYVWCMRMQFFRFWSVFCNGRISYFHTTPMPMNEEKRKIMLNTHLIPIFENVVPRIESV